MAGVVSYRGGHVAPKTRALVLCDKNEYVKLKKTQPPYTNTYTFMSFDEIGWKKEAL